MRARCPNDEDHKEFLTTAHVLEEWQVDESGSFQSVSASLDTTHPPHPDNLWTCVECGADAKVEP